MKKIKLTNYSLPDNESVYVANKAYRVMLGNGYSASFSSHKEILAFLAQTNKELNNKMYELNFLYSEVLKMYRAAWPYFDTGSRTIKNNLQGIILDKVAVLEQNFNLMVDRSDWENGNHMVFNHFYSTIETLKSICLLLVELYTTKSHTVIIYEIESLIGRLNHIHTSIVIYPQKIKLVTENRQIKAVLNIA